LSVAYSDLSANAKLTIGALLSIVSTFSSANGILCWMLVLPVLLVVCGWRKRFVPFLIAGWMALCLLSVSFYLYGYQTPDWHPSLTQALDHPVRAPAYLAAFLGAPLAPGAGVRRLAAAIPIGAIASILFFGACAYLGARFADRSLRKRMIGFVALGAYSLGTALMVMPARLGFGITQALSSRYSTFSLYLLVSLIYLAAIVLEHARTNGYLRSRAPRVRFVFAGVGILLLVHALTAASGVLQARVFRAKVLYFKACLLFVNVLRSPGPEILIKSSHRDLTALANALNRLGYLRPSLIDGTSIEEIALSGQETWSTGAFENLLETADGRFSAEGRAVLPGGREPAHAVLLTYRDATQAPRVFAIAEMEFLPGGLIGVLRQPVAERNRWQHTFTRADVPYDGSTHIDAWAFDTESGNAFKLTGSHVVGPLR
jgi:hypothetical protein